MLVALRWPADLRLGPAGEVEQVLAGPVTGMAGSRMRPPAIHGKMRFPLNSGQTNAVKTRQGLGGDTVGLPKSSRKYKGYPRVTQGLPKGYPRVQHRANTVAIPWQFGVSKTLDSRWGWRGFGGSGLDWRAGAYGSAVPEVAFHCSRLAR